MPRRLAAVLGRCLSPDPEKRPTAGELRREFDAYLARRTARRRIAVVAGVVLLGGGLAVALARNDSPEERELPSPAPVVPTGPKAARPLSADALLASGMSHLKNGEVSAAIKDVSDARRAKPDGRNAAYLAYCHNRAGGHRTAAELYRVAAEAEGYGKAWVFNNWAYSLCQFDQGPEHYRSAIEKATRALELSPTLRPALHNRAVARFFLTRDPATQTVTDARCAADIEAVVNTGEETAELHYHAAAILSASAAGDPAILDRAARHLEQSVALGRSPRSLASDPVLAAHLSNRPQFRALATAAPPATRLPPQPSIMLMAPAD